MKVKQVALVVLAFPVIAFAAGKPVKAADKPPKLLRNETWACIPAASPQGMNWENKQWVAHEFQEPEKFTLNVAEIQEEGLPVYLHMTIKDSDQEQHCGTVKNYTFDGFDACSNTGQTIVFSKSTGRGAVSYVLGALTNTEQRDSVSVMPFTCQSF